MNTGLESPVKPAGWKAWLESLPYTVTRYPLNNRVIVGVSWFILL
jgi:hypothetical protein